MRSWTDPMWLREVPTAQLVEELARRANSRPTRKPQQWCESCAHFVAWVDRSPPPQADCPDDYNPCAKQHTMRFHAPEGYDEDYGFYRTVCPDREITTEGEREVEHG